MFELYADGDRLVLASEGSNGEAARSGINLHALSPILLGLLLPLAAVYIWDPSGLRHARLIVYTMLFGLMCAAVVLFVFSVLNPGQIVSVVCNKTEQMVELAWSGTLTNKVVSIPFGDIALAHVRADYDQDGYGTTVAELVLRSRETIPLPAGITELQVRYIRQAIGLV